jgi:hypothetical protein
MKIMRSGSKNENTWTRISENASPKKEKDWPLKKAKRR